jgi:hypothetical protein
MKIERFKPKAKLAKEQERQQATLDRAISAALGNGATIADDLLYEIKQGIELAELDAQAERAKSLDPSTSPHDAEQAAERASVAELRRDRLRAALPRIQQKIDAMERARSTEQWSGDADIVAAWVAAAEKKLAATYGTCAAQIAAALKEAEAANQEVDKINAAVPAGIHRRVGKVSTAHLRDLVLPDPDPQHAGRRKLWPPRSSLALYGDEASFSERDQADMIRSRRRALADAIENDRQRPQREADAAAREAPLREKFANEREREQWGRLHPDQYVQWLRQRGGAA